MTAPKVVPSLEHAQRVLPDQLLAFHLPDADLVMLIESPKNSNDPYLTVRYEHRPHKLNVTHIPRVRRN